MLLSHVANNNLNPGYIHKIIILLLNQYRNIFNSWANRFAETFLLI
jgi:hypothetical protein